MNLHPDEPRLTSYLLGELPAGEAVAVERALEEDPVLRQAFDDLLEVRQVLTAVLAPGPGALLPAQRETILRAARDADQTGTVEAPLLLRISWRRWQAPLAAAAAILLAAVLSVVIHHGWRHPARGHVATAKAPPPAPVDYPPHTLPAPGPADANPPDKAPEASAAAGLADAKDFPVLLTRGAVTATTCPTLALPVRAGDASLAWITAALLTDHRLPSRDAVRLEEILNHFTLRPNGPGVVARQPASKWHPDDRSPGTSTHVATLTSESLTCPWQPSASFVLVSFRGNPFSDCDVQAVFRPNPATVGRYRLLGFAAAAGQAQAPLPTRLPAQTSTLLALEIQPAANPAAAAADIGRIEWSVNGQPAESLTLRPPDAAQEPSADARFAALICTFAQWLTHDPAVAIDRDMLAAIARQVAATPDLPTARADFLLLIERALKL